MATGIRLEGLGRLRDALVRAEEELGPRNGVLKAVGVQAFSEVSKWIRTGGNGSWRPLAETTQRAKRRGGGGLPLSRFLELTTWHLLPGTGVEVAVSHPAAKWQHRGTRGPYEIRAKNAKMLAIPGLGFQNVRELSGRGGRFAPNTAPNFTLAGLGRSRQTTGGAFRFANRGQANSARFQGREGQRVRSFGGAVENGKVTVGGDHGLAFFKSVMHPGLTARPLFPPDEELLPKLVAAAEFMLQRKLGGRA